MNKIDKPREHTYFMGLFTIIFLVLIFPQFILASTIQSNNTQSSPSINDKLLWGTYKPHLISAVTQRSTHPITVGMAFSNNKAAFPSLDSFKDNLRFRMNRGIFAQYTHHNGIDFSRQAIFDDVYNLFYDTAFIKDFSSADPTLQQWTYKIYGAEQEHQKQSSEKQPFYTFLYIALEDLEGGNQDSRQIQIVENLEQDDSIILKVTDSKTGASSGFFRVSVTGSKDKKDGSNSVKGISRCLVSDKDKTKTWNVEDIIQSKLKTNIFKGAAYLDPVKCNGDPNNVNFVAIQVTATSAFEIVTTYNSKEVPQFDLNKIEETILKREQALEISLETKLPITGLNKYKFDLKEAREIQRFAISNLLGGILYSYGGIKIDSPYDREYGSEGTRKMELFTGSPSRFGFPRGFLWDEGFHETVICKWDAEICMEIIKSWFNTMQADGWIPREQARGEELESNFKQKEFLRQTPLEANPPSMILPLLELVDKTSKSNSESSEKIRSFLLDILVKLKKWLYWFAKSQLNDLESSGHFFESLDKKSEENQYYFRWSCKDPSEGKYFASGLDDYPRNFQDEQPTGNIDLHSWLLVVANGILSIEDFLQHQRSADILKLENHLRKSFANFIDPKENLVKDFALQYEHGNEEEEEQEHEGPLTNPIGKIFAPYQGYVNLFPIFFGNLEPNSPELKATLEIIGSPEKLWTQYGIRSLSKSDEYFMEIDGYWTEPIWMPMNFLLLRGLKKYYSDNEEAQQIYRALRENLVKTMSMNWKMDLYLWENYDSFTGVGKGFPGFTGWTSLMALIYAEQY